MKTILDWLIARLSENSTWRGIILFLTSCGVAISPEMCAQIVSAGLGLVGLINIIRKEKTTPAGQENASPLGKVGVMLALSIAVFATGCGTFTTKQKDISYDETTGKKIREITTQAKAATLFDSKSQLATFKASQTDKIQSATVGGLNFETKSPDTLVSNAVSAATK